MVKLVQPSFASGEIAPRLYGRVDISKYAIALRTAKNAIVYPSGGIANRPGTKFVGPAKAHSTNVRLIPFEASSSDTYALEFSNLAMRPIRNGGHVLETAKTISGATSANPVVITANSHGYENGDEVRITEVVGMTQLNQNRYLVSNKTTNTFELRGEDSTGHTAYSSGGTFARDFTSANSAAMSTTNTITISWTAVAGAEKYDIFKEDNGIYGFIGSSTSTEFTDDNIDPDLTDTPPQQKNPFFGANNKPSCVSYYQQRRVFGNTNNKPDTIFYTQTGNQSNFNVSSPSRDDDAITAALSALQLNEIRHFVPQSDLLCLN